MRTDFLINDEIRYTMKFTQTFNPDNNKVVFILETNLLNRYFSNLKGLVENDKDVPSDIEVEQRNSNTALISFSPGPESSSVQKIGDSNSSSYRIAIDSRKVESINRVLNKFTRCALKKELMSTEFVPLEGYPEDNLKEEIVAALEGKRKLCILKDYDEYLSMQEKDLYVFHQYILEYGTNEYVNAILYIRNGNFNKLKELYSDKLVLTDWN